MIHFNLNLLFLTFSFSGPTSFSLDYYVKFNFRFLCKNPSRIILINLTKSPFISVLLDMRRRHYNLSLILFAIVWVYFMLYFRPLIDWIKFICLSFVLLALRSCFNFAFIFFSFLICWLLIKSLILMMIWITLSLRITTMFDAFEHASTKLDVFKVNGALFFETSLLLFVLRSIYIALTSISLLLLFRHAFPRSID